MEKLEQPYRIDRRLINPPHHNDLHAPNVASPIQSSDLAVETIPLHSSQSTPPSTSEDADMRTRELLQKNLADMDFIIIALTRRRNQDYLLYHDVNARIQPRQSVHDAANDEAS